MIFFEEDNVEELEALQVCNEDNNPWPAVDTVDINSLISAQDVDDADSDDSVIIDWYESLW